jgi:hypothetical protein
MENAKALVSKCDNLVSLFELPMPDFLERAETGLFIKTVGLI